MRDFSFTTCEPICVGLSNVVREMFIRPFYKIFPLIEHVHYYRSE